MQTVIEGPVWVGGAISRGTATIATAPTEETATRVSWTRSLVSRRAPPEFGCIELAAAGGSDPRPTDPPHGRKPA